MDFKEAYISTDVEGKYLVRIYHCTKESGFRGYRHHRHTEFEISLCLNGSGIYLVDKTEYTFQRGDIFFFTSNEPHCLINIDENEPIDLLNLKIEPRFIWSPGNSMFDIKYLKIFFERNENFRNLFDRSCDATQQIRNNLLDIEKEFSQKQEAFELLVKIKLLEILVLALQRYDYVKKDEGPKENKKRSISEIEKAMSYINDNLDQDISLEDISVYVSLNKSYLCDLFKKLNGLTVWEYITFKRVEKACSLLKDSDKPVSEICYDCGFNNNSTFIRAFKKVTGRSPRNYRDHALDTVGS